MERKLPFTPKESVRLRVRMEDHLTAVFAAGSINKYNQLNSQPAEWQMITGNAGDTLSLPVIKSAHYIWLNMYAADRHAVLRKFQYLYAIQRTAEQANRGTLVFCALFVHELAAILAGAMEWPD